MLLNISERIALSTALPVQGNYVTLGVIEELKKKLGFDDDEIKQFKIVHTPTSVKWDTAKEGEKDIHISPVERDLICSALKTRDQQSTLLPVQMKVFKKFVIDGKADG